MKEIEVGTGGTYYVGSDRYPVTVIEVVRANKVIVQFDEFRIEDAFSGYGIPESYKPDPNGRKMEVTKRKRGWGVLGEAQRVSFEGRDAYRDPSF